MQKAAALFAQVQENLRRAAQGAQNGVDPQYAARVAAAQATVAKAKAVQVKAEAEEAEGAENVVAGAAVSVKMLHSY